MKLIWLWLWLLIAVPAWPQKQPFWRPVVMGNFGMVAAEHPLQALAGLHALEAGGNAIDAAVAVFYTTTVVEQHQAGIGGDAFILAYIAKEKRVVFINGTGPAAKLATPEFYRKRGGIPAIGPLSSTVPGAVGGFALAHQLYGSLPHAQLLRDAIALAEDGHPLSHWSASSYREGHPRISRFPSSVRALTNQGRPFEAGQIHIQPDLARTLKTIAADGPGSFYRGSLSQLTADFYEKEQGLIRREDLAVYRAEQSEPVRTVYKDFEVFQSAPNSQGIVLLIALNIVEGLDLRSMGHNSTDYVHAVTEAIKLAFADRDRYIADPRFVKDIPIEQLLSKSYAAKRRELIRMDRAIRGAAPPGDPRGGKPVLDPYRITYEDRRPAPAAAPTRAGQGETSSFSIADRFGNLVSVTHSVNQTFGSAIVVEGGGYVLNNRMPYFGLDDRDVNVLAPGKRPRHTINPALALRGGKPFLAWNTPGGDNQPQAMLQAFLNVVEFGMNVQQAVEAPTVTSSSFQGSMYPHTVAGLLTIPKLLADRIVAELLVKGHKVDVADLQQPYGQQPSGAGAVKMVLIDPATGVIHGGASPAKDNYVMGR
ncbi:MAG: gamma-glutamyltransferase family protein [Bryobacteraceae bacterium]